jgi:cation diffusion facilitator family transporter
MVGHQHDLAVDEKKHAAWMSVWAAVGLTLIKVVVGLATGSLGILAEAAHSALDLVAAAVTYLAVRISGKPADEEHPYGHGKVENLSALFETLLLLLTCAWIVVEAVERLFFKSAQVQASVAGFLVILISIGVDINRSRMLSRTAHKYNSQALEADALHFSTDIWSSLVVLAGLAGVKLGKVFPAFAFLEKADAIAALGVAIIVVYISVSLASRTIKVLLDSAPSGMLEKVTQLILQHPGVHGCHKVRVRHAGPSLFIDAHVLVDGKQSLYDAHKLTDEIEASIRHEMNDVDVTVHAEPVMAGDHTNQGR